MKRALLTLITIGFLPIRLLAQAELIRVPLQPLDTYLPNTSNQVGTSQSTDFTSFQGIPDNLTGKAIRSHNTIRGQTQYEAYQQGKLTKTEWESIKKTLDTTTLSPVPIHQRINALVGTDQQGRRVVIVDQNNNQDFSDDRVLTYPMVAIGIKRNDKGLYTPEIQVVYKTLPTIQLQVETYDGKAAFARTIWIKPNPYNDGWTYRDSTESRYHLSYLAAESRQGSVNLLGHSLSFLISSGMAGIAYNTPLAVLEMRKDNQADVPAVKGQYKIGESFYLESHSFQIVNISPAGNLLYLARKD